MEFFTDLIDALGKVVEGVKALVNLPKTERETIRRTLDETYRLLDTTLNMVIIRLGDIQLHSADPDFLAEAAKLDNYGEWIKAEREFRLCRSLRVTLRETQSLAGKLAVAASANDWNSLVQQMKAILATEGEVAMFIGGWFQTLAGNARSANQDIQKTQALRSQLSDFRAALVAQRQKLIQQEVELFTIV